MPALAHHSFGPFDFDHTVTIKGATGSHGGFFKQATLLETGRAVAVN